MEREQSPQADALFAESYNPASQGGRPALVLMPFLGGTTHVWDEVIPLLGPDQPVLALDLPGFGGSAHVTGYSVAAMADAVQVAIARAGLRRFVLVGHSMAGKVSAVLARRLAGAPALAGLVLVAPSPPSPEPMGEEKRHSMLGLLGERHADDEARARSYVTRNEQRDLPREVEERTTREVLRMNRTAWVAWLEHGSREDWSGFVGVLDLPALVVAGEKDASLGPPQQRQVTMPHLAQGRLVAVEGCSHLIPLERPERMASLLQEFVAQLPPADVPSALPGFVPQAYLDFLASDRVSVPTRVALVERMQASASEPGTLSAEQELTLRAMLGRVLPLSKIKSGVDLAACVMARLSAGKGDGWRYDVLPGDLAAYREGLDRLIAQDFANLPEARQDEILQALAGDRNPANSAGARWFEEVRSDAAGCWVAHPATMARLGFSGPGVGGAYTPHRGFANVGANEREAWEPLPVNAGDRDEGVECSEREVNPALSTLSTALPPPSPLPGWAAEMRAFPQTEAVDVVVIGTGAGAAPVLAVLAEAGRSVVALEAGRWWNPGAEYAADETRMAELYWSGERISAGANPTAFGGNNSGTGVGGSMLHWGAFVPRADRRDLKLRSDTGEGVNFPMTYDDLQPFYEELEAYLGVAGPAHYPWDAGRRYPLGPLAINAPGQAMQRGFAALGLRTAPAPIAAVSRIFAQAGYGDRPPCVGCGFCHQGCVYGAKASMDVTYLPRALAAGAEIRAQSFVHGFERDSDGRITAVLYRAQGKECRQPCKAVFLCAGAVETPRLLLHAGLANSSGQVGRNFMVHVATQVWGTFAEEMRMNKGFPATVISEDTLRPADADFAAGYLVQSLGVVPVTFARQVARGRGLWGQPLVDQMDRYNHLAGIGINGDCLPYDGNFLELSDEMDLETGMAKPRIHFTYGENELKMRRHASDLMTRAWQEAGASDIWTFDRSAHTIGTCRMGADPGASVVDAWGRSHDVPNLWISDNSTFPAALAANPALTIMALALRSARRFLAG